MIWGSLLFRYLGQAAYGGRPEPRDAGSFSRNRNFYCISQKMVIYWILTENTNKMQAASIA